MRGAAVLLATLLLPACATTPAGGSLFAGADPAPLVADGQVWLYPTGGDGALHGWRRTVDGSWQRGPALIRLDQIGWIPPAEQRHLWAPHMAAANGRYYLYYSVGPQEPWPAKIGVAVCDTPAGPCTDSGRPLLDGADSATITPRPRPVCPDGMAPTGSGRFRFEAIDPMVFTDPATGHHLLYAGGSNGSVLRLWELAPDMVSITREVPVDQPPCFTEGAWMHRRGDTYYLSYSSGHYDRSDYSVRYATAPSATGPWTYRGTILTSAGTIKGPGHHGLFTDPATGQDMIAYHQWEGQAGDGPYRNASRQVAIAPLRYDADGTIQPVDPSVHERAR